MSNNNVKNFFEQTPGSSTGGTSDNVLHLEGTVVGKAGTQAAFVTDGVDAATTQTLANALKAIMIDTGLMAPS